MNFREIKFGLFEGTPPVNTALCAKPGDESFEYEIYHPKESNLVDKGIIKVGEVKKSGDENSDFSWILAAVKDSKFLPDRPNLLTAYQLEYGRSVVLPNPFVSPNGLLIAWSVKTYSAFCLSAMFPVTEEYVLEFSNAAKITENDLKLAMHFFEQNPLKAFPELAACFPK